jgi:hypothetical protein
VALFWWIAPDNVGHSSLCSVIGGWINPAA